MASGDVGEIVRVSVLAGLSETKIGAKRKNRVLALASIGISPWEDCI